MRLVFAGGGTGGHVYPALSVADAVTRLAPDAELLYLGTPSGAERGLVQGREIRFQTVHAGQVRGKAPWRTALSLLRVSRGVLEARAALRCFRPDAVFATGGYASVPVLLAARMAGIPLTVFLPDVYPGWAVRFAARLATRVAASTEGALAFLPREKTTVTGYPLRREFWQADRARARNRFGLGDGPVVLVSGASSGSRALNDAVIDVLPELLATCEVVHLTGIVDESRVAAAREALPEPVRSRYTVLGYLDDMPSAMAAADIAVMRAGASCLAEPPALGLPAILVPGPFSDQQRNAKYMVSEGAALVLEQPRLPDLLNLIGSLLASPERLTAMRACALRLARPRAAESLAALLLGEASVEYAPEGCLR